MPMQALKQRRAECSLRLLTFVAFPSPPRANVILAKSIFGRMIPAAQRTIFVVESFQI
jgi:hypothetical protein